ncbi:STAS domain-containing protein [Streptomyces sp. YC504]|uniref:STAS domain-containing protein n=1 Tax=Streptomyces mesophilus TaxID=1775132 RepID=A0A6G4XRJ7_9ACTN|nr:STAS domain-containing protein [Streptomyces mesophilus]NGO79410.1 STAS domain-containing protein [Streptomyces mesophilus]
MMTLHWELQGTALVVSMPAEVDIGNAAQIAGELREVCRTRLTDEQGRSVRLVVMDWSTARFLTTAGLTLIEDFHSRLEQLGLTAHLVTGRRLPRKVLHLVGLAGRLPLFDSVRQALSATETSAVTVTAPR